MNHNLNYFWGGRGTLGLLVVLLGIHFRLGAGLATVWHIPDNATDLPGINLRNPEFEIGTNTVITFYTGLWKYSGATQLANQTGGWLIYKGASQALWSSNALTWVTNTASNQYWKGSCSSSAFGANEVIQYYFLLTFDGTAGVTNTFLYGGDGGSSTTGSAALASVNPFSVRNRAAWIWHNQNRVISAGTDLNHFNAAFWTKVGYVAKSDLPSTSWIDHGVIYYTTNGAAPVGALGVAGVNTFAAPMFFDHPENDSSVSGDGMWWVGSVSNLPLYAAIRYRIGFWNSANNEEKFGDYNAGVPASIFSFTNGVPGSPVLAVNGVNADYTTSHVFVDERNRDSVPLTILFSPNVSNLLAVDVFSNANRRDRATLDANHDGIEDGIVPPDGNAIATGDDHNYYKAYAMTALGNGQYAFTLNLTNTGAYRLTARFQVAGNPNWFWYSGGSTGRRDHAIVVTPTKARNMVMYELNAMNIGAQGTNSGDRSTFADLCNGPGARPYDAVTNRFNLNYFQNLGVNWLWFQPMHPIGLLNRQIDPNSGQAYSVGSPYSVKNFFQVNPLLSKANTRAAALQEFTNFVTAADLAGVNVMLDEPFNHSAWDAELDAAGVTYFQTNARPGDLIANSEPRFYSRSNEYDQRANSAPGIAPAPDRYDFGKWADVADIYYGRYAALVGNASQTGNQVNEGDWFDYSVGAENTAGSGNGHFDAITQNVWRYFSDCLLYWLDQTGCPPGTPVDQTFKGIDGLRADFGQGLPPQCWEYIINKVRTRKWDFVFMTESLDGGAVTYRSNRHFDVLNENLIFSLQSAATAGDYRNAFDSRRGTYGQSLLLLNNVSHDEPAYGDPYDALIRYLVCGAMDGAPMTFYGEELGISTYFGFDRYQLNFSKTIPHFMVYNDLQPVLNPANRTFGLDQLWPVYAGVNQARQVSPALRSSNRYYLNQVGIETPQAKIFSVAKYETANSAPNFHDVVFAFSTLDRNHPQAGTFEVNITQNGANLFGIQPARIYNVKNISAYSGATSSRRREWLWAPAIAGSNVLANGIWVALNPVPTNNSDWTNAPFEAQYLKLYDVTPPPAPVAVSVLGATNNYVFGNCVTFVWPAVSDAEGGVSGYQVSVGTTPGGNNIFNGLVYGTSLTLTNTFGVRLYAAVSTVNNAGIASAVSSSLGIMLLDPAWVPVVRLNDNHLLNWSSVSGQIYQVWSSPNLAQPFTAFSGMVTASAPALVFTNLNTNAGQFFQIRWFP